MKKRLIFFVYVAPEYENSKIYDLHLANLEKYSYIFDAATIYFSVKEFNDKNLSIVKELTKRIVDIGYVKELETKIRLNTDMREADCFKEEVIGRIKANIDELVFFTHTKGLSNNLDLNLIRWINGMYFFGLNFNEELDERMIYRALPDTKRGGCLMFGFPLMRSEMGNYLKNMCYYAGTIFWIHCSKVAHYNRCFGIDPDKDYIYDTRCFAEEFPGDYFLDTVLGQHGCYCGIPDRVSLYSEYDVEFEMFLSSYDSYQDRIEYENHCKYIMDKIGLRV